jgi:hypothetical protein
MISITDSNGTKLNFGKTKFNDILSLATDAPKRFKAEITKAAEAAGYELFTETNDVLENKIATNIATTFLQNPAAGADAAIMAEMNENDRYTNSAHSYARSLAYPIAESILRSLDEHAKTPATLNQFDDAMELVIDMLTDAMFAADKSKPIDIIGRCDRAEIFVFFTNGEYLEDAMIWSNKPWSVTNELRPDGNLRDALSQIGYGITEFKKTFGNRHPNVDMAGHRGTRRREKLIEPTKLEEIIDNACSQHFLIGWYGIVPLRDVLALDTKKPFTVTGGEIGTYNPYSGTYHGCSAIQKTITFKPKSVSLRGCGNWYTPDDICGFVRSCLHADISNTQPMPKTKPPVFQSAPLSANI